jgi:hypothetical protein
MQFGDYAGLFEAFVIAKAARWKVKGVLMFSERVLWAIFRVPK